MTARTVPFGAFNSDAWRDSPGSLPMIVPLAQPAKAIGKASKLKRMWGDT
jgi:hypothetical protein